MNRILIMTAIIVLTITIISSSSLTDVLAKGKVAKGPIECNLIPNSDLIQCCQTETDSKGVEIKYCTNCDDTVPPSNCTPRFQSAYRTLPSDLPAVEQNPTVSPTRDHPPLTTDNLEQLPTTTLQQKTELCPDGSALDAKGNCSTVENKIQPPPSSDNNQLKGESESEKNVRNDNNPNDKDLTSDDDHEENDVEETSTPK